MIYQEIISTIAALLLGWLLKIIIKRNNNLDKTLKEMNREITLARVDSKTVMNVLIRLSNGIKYDDLIDEERARLMQDINFKYKD